MSIEKPEYKDSSEFIENIKCITQKLIINN